MSKGGRPPLPNRADVRGGRFSVYVSATERAAITEKAARMGMTPPQFLRECALGQRIPSPPVPAINTQKYAELARLASNLNQLAHAANVQGKIGSGGSVQVDSALLEQVRAELAGLRLALLGAGGGHDCER